ncbi:MAG: DinB family protein [Cyclobacteriaceae bacterium]
MNQTLKELFVRDLNKVKSEIESITNESDLWRTKPGITNPAGNLALHIAGNLQHFIGHILGNSNYQRNREREFNNHEVAKSQILSELDDAIAAINDTIPTVDTNQWAKDFPVDVFGKPMSTEAFVLHLLTHLNYHLGQINYIRRILTHSEK